MYGEAPTGTSEKARANEISSTRSSATYELADYGLENFVSNETLDNQDLPFNERADMVADQRCDALDEPVAGTVEAAGRRRRRGDINGAHGNKRAAFEWLICAEIESDRH